MEEQKGVTEKGGTMRLGGYACSLKKGSLVQEAYQVGYGSGDDTGTAMSSITTFWRTLRRMG